jgi:16S rRNA (uracil1498-N3)-methyltransferase
VPRPRLIVASLPGPGERIRLAGEEAAHARARRLEEGSAVVLIDGSGREAAARVVRMERSGCELRVESLEDAALDSAPPVHLLVAAVRAERLGWLGEKAAELGAASLTVVASERTQTFRARDGMLARLRRIVRESAKQAAASRFTAVDGPLPLADALAAADSGTRLLLDPGGAPFPDRLPAAPVSILVGPEGGLTDAERSAAVEAGWRAVALPAGVVRAETAAIAAIVLARAALLRKP